MCEHLCGMRCICCLLQPHTFPFPSTASYGTNRHSSQQWGHISAQHFRSKAQNQPSPVPQQWQGTDQCWWYLIAAPSERSSRKQNESFLISSLPNHVDFGAHLSPTAAVLSKNKQQKLLKIFAVNLLGMTSFIATDCYMLLKSV